MDEPLEKLRLDVVLAKNYPEYSRSLIQKLIKEGRVKVDGFCLKKPSVQITPESDIKIDLTDLNKPKATINVEVLYEDNDVVVVNKPTGILTHSKGAFNPETSLADWLKLRKNYCFYKPTDTSLEIVKSNHRSAKQNVLKNDVVSPGNDLAEIPKRDAELRALHESRHPDEECVGDNDRGGIVHRLDRATSGVVICAKNTEALGYLQKQFAKRTTKKIYLAIIEGHLKNDEAMIDIPIGRNPKDPKTFRPDPRGKPAQTAYKVLEKNDKYSLLELKPITGRTHQLRVHLKYLNHPIIGDTFYGGKKAERLMLHASSLEITLPKGDMHIFTSPKPKDFIL